MKNISAQISSAVRTLGRRTARWIDDRTGVRSILARVLHERIPGGARAAYVFGSGLLCIFLLQIVTGISLALYYTPTAETAHTSVSYIIKQVAGGAFLRSMHSYGSSAMIIVLVLHFLQTFFYGSFKGRRELVWLSGAVLSFMVLSMGFTGYLLPWDQKAYFATTVGTNVAGQVPLIGGFITRILRGGNMIGTLTLSRFYLAHVFIIPATIVLFVGAHVFLFRKAGPAGPVHEHPSEPRLPSEPFYPRQVLYDMAAALAIVAILAALSYLRPVTLGPIANPSDSAFLPRPEWYYLPMFEWLKFWEGPFVVVGVVVIPGAIATAFFLMPFLDRRLERRPWRRPIPALAVSIVILAMVALGARSRIEDSREPFAAQLARQHTQEIAYTAAPFEPWSADNSAAVAVKTSASLRTDPRIARGKALFIQHGCIGCHGSRGTGSAAAPALVGITRTLSAQQISALLQNPSPRMKSAGMPTVPSSETDVLIAYLGVLGTPAAAVAPQFSDPPEATESRPPTPRPQLQIQRIVASSVARAGTVRRVALDGPAGAGKQVFEERGCFACHGQEGTGGPAPALAPMVAPLDDAELQRLLRNPNPRMRKGGMEGVPDATPDELAALIAYLRSMHLPANHSEPVVNAQVAEPDVGPAHSAPGQPRPAFLPATSDHVLIASLEKPAPPQSLAAPAAASVASGPAQAGRAVFKARGCTGCHGYNANGTQMAPSLLGVVSRHPGAELPSLLRNPNARMRAGGMPTPKVNDQELAQLVAYLTSLAPAPVAQPAAPAANLVADAVAALNPTSADLAQPLATADAVVARGQSVFRRHGCSSCHGEDGIQGTAAAPALAGSASLLPAETLQNMLRHHSDRMKKGGMPVTNFSPQDLASIVSYIRSLPIHSAANLPGPGSE